HELYRYCVKEQITFTRARPMRKNDSCLVEEKNYSVVRRNVGYGRYDTPKELAVLNELYGHLRLYTNYFLPTMKLVSKERTGSQVKKVYDDPTTPYKRVLASPDVKQSDKKRLREIYSTLNPAQLKRNITSLQEKLLRIGVMKEQKRRDKQPGSSRKAPRIIGRAQPESR
ncbi:MAG: transposase, partial [Terriglobia bacterium]